MGEDGGLRRRRILSATIRRASDLYGLPLEEFTPARDSLARELRRAGKKEAADEAKALRKPSVSAWAVNQAARREPEAVRALVKAGGELRKAQRDAVSGKDPSAFHEATRKHRGLVDDVTAAAHEALEARGAVSPAVVIRVAQTLRGASVDKEASKALLAGTLSGDVEQTGFGPLLAAVPEGTRRTAAQKRPAKEKPQPKPKAAKPKRDPNAAKRAKVEKELERARAKARELEERLERLSKQ